MTPRLGMLLALAYPLVLLLLPLGSPADLITVVAAIASVAAAALCLAALAAPVRAAASSPVASGVPLRDRAHRTRFLRSRDPDADGRPRPRAPGRSPAAA